MMKKLMQILSLTLSTMLVVCSIVQFHHHHDDNSMCIAIHDKSCTHHHHHTIHHDAEASICHSHGHQHNPNCSLHLSDTINSNSQIFVDNNSDANIIVSIALFITDLIPDLLSDASHACWPDIVIIGNPLSACVSGWSLRAPPCA